MVCDRKYFIFISLLLGYFCCGANNVAQKSREISRILWALIRNCSLKVPVQSPRYGPSAIGAEGSALNLTAVHLYEQHARYTSVHGAAEGPSGLLLQLPAHHRHIHGLHRLPPAYRMRRKGGRYLRQQNKYLV